MRRALPERLARLAERVQRCDGGGGRDCHAGSGRSFARRGYRRLWREAARIVLTKVVCVLAEHGNSHGTDATGHGRDVRALRGTLNCRERTWWFGVRRMWLASHEHFLEPHLIKIHVALHHILFHLPALRFFIGVLVLDAVDPDVNHDGPRLDPVPANVLSLANRCDYNVGVPALRGLGRVDGVSVAADQRRLVTRAAPVILASTRQHAPSRLYLSCGSGSM